MTAEVGNGVQLLQVAYKQLRTVCQRVLSQNPSVCSSDSFDQDHSLPGLGLLGTVVRVFGVVGARAAQVQEAEASLQAEALLGAGGGAAAVVVGGGWSVVQISLCTFCPVTCTGGKTQRMICWF